MGDWDWKTLTRYEQRPFELAGKPYIWVRVNGQLQAVSALRPDGSFTGAALDRVIEGK